MVSLETASRTRGLLKQEFIAQAAIVPKLLEERAEAMKLVIKQLTREKSITEYDLVEALQQEFAELLHELPWAQLLRKFVLFQIADLERRRVDIHQHRRNQ